MPIWFIGKFLCQQFSGYELLNALSYYKQIHSQRLRDTMEDKTWLKNNCSIKINHWHQWMNKSCNMWMYKKASSFRFENWYDWFTEKNWFKRRICSWIRHQYFSLGWLLLHAGMVSWYRVVLHVVLFSLTENHVNANVIKCCIGLGY